MVRVKMITTTGVIYIKSNANSWNSLSVFRIFLILAGNKTPSDFKQVSDKKKESVMTL